MNSSVFGKKKAIARPVPIFGKKHAGGNTMFGRKAIGAIARRGQGIARQVGDYAASGSDLAGLASVLQPELAPVLLPAAAGLRGLSMAARGIGARTAREAGTAGASAARAYARR